MVASDDPEIKRFHLRYGEAPLGDWVDDALCYNRDDLNFHPERGTPHREIKAAKELCHQCPVQVDCLKYALKVKERFGIWGGLTERERRQIRRQNLRLDEIA